jgi:hypothetical protein
MLFRQGLALFFLWLFLGGTARACDLCGCPLLPGPLEAQTRAGWQVGIFEQYTGFGTIQMDGQVVANPEGQFLNSSITQLVVSHTFEPGLSLQLNLPYVRRSFRRTRGHDLQTGTVSGLGDASLVARYMPVRQFEVDRALTWTLLAGLKMPTGSASFLAEEGQEEHHQEEEGEGGHRPLAPSAVHGHDLALGSGSWDVLLGTAFLVREGAFFLGGHAQYTVRTRGSFGYRYADDLQWSLGPGLYFHREPDLLAGLQLNLSGDSKGKDDIQGVPVEDTGFQALYLGPQFTVTGLDLSAQVGVELPLRVDNSSLQITPDYRLKAALNWRL